MELGETKFSNYISFRKNTTGDAVQWTEQHHVMSDHASCVLNLNYEMLKEILWLKYTSEAQTEFYLPNACEEQ